MLIIGYVVQYILFRQVLYFALIEYFIQAQIARAVSTQGHLVHPVEPVPPHFVDLQTTAHFFHSECRRLSKVLLDIIALMKMHPMAGGRTVIAMYTTRLDLTVGLGKQFVEAYPPEYRQVQGQRSKTPLSVVEFEGESWEVDPEHIVSHLAFYPILPKLSNPETAGAVETGNLAKYELPEWSSLEGKLVIVPFGMLFGCCPTLYRTWKHADPVCEILEIIPGNFGIF